MSYKAIVYNVMIASPSDVAEEREVVRRVINNWNKSHSSKDEGIVLLPVDWENHSAPRQGNRGQEVINKQVLEKADLLIGIFWNRVGTPTGDFKSGTVEEIERHIQAGRPAMLYFSDKPSPYDAKSQRAQVEKLKAKYQSNGLTGSFKSTQEFEEKLKDHIVTTLKDRETFPRYNRITSINQISTLDVTTPFELTEKARQLLTAMSKSPNGELIITRTIGANEPFESYMIYGGLFYKTKDLRETKEYRGYIDELVKNKFIESKGSSTTIYEIRNEGFKYLES